MPALHPSSGTALKPSPSLLSNLRQALVQHPPFAQMDAADVDYFLSHSQQQYFAPDECLLQPTNGPVQHLYFVRQGAVRGTQGLAEQMGAFAYEVGDLFPVSAALVGRAVTATYLACGDTFVLALPTPAMHALAARSTPFAGYLTERTAHFLELSRRALQATFANYSATHAAAQQTLESPLGALIGTPPISCTVETPLLDALQVMHETRVGSMLVVDAAGRPSGILTRHDLLGRIVLAGVALNRPIGDVMTSPVRSLTIDDTAEDAALLMSRYSLRHVPVTKGGIAIGMVSERDLFASQRLSLQGVSHTLRVAKDVAALQAAAQEIRRLARNLLGQGVQARQLTTLISHLNDLLTERLLHLQAVQHDVDLSTLCWLALGSEGRSEQTIATDQDNALILPSGIEAAQRAHIRAFAKSVNLALDACGYPLCKGGIMASEPPCCLTLDEWLARFSQWIAQGSPQDLLNASIYFDFRPLAGDSKLAETLRSKITASARATPRFLKQLALNALTRHTPLNWRGALDTDDQGLLDLKLSGTAIFVDAARIFCLARGIEDTNTRLRLEAAGRQLQLAPAEYGAWVSAFEFLQLLRLRVQLEGDAESAANVANSIRLAELNGIDQRILREAMRMARQLQQVLKLDYDR